MAYESFNLVLEESPPKLCSCEEYNMQKERIDNLEQLNECLRKENERLRQKCIGLKREMKEREEKKEEFLKVEIDSDVEPEHEDLFQELNAREFTFADMAGMSIPVFRRNGKKRYSCLYCAMDFCSRQDSKKHMFRNHRDKVIEVCSIFQK